MKLTSTTAKIVAGIGGFLLFVSGAEAQSEDDYAADNNDGNTTDNADFAAVAGTSDDPGMKRFLFLFLFSYVCSFVLTPLSLSLPLCGTLCLTLTHFLSFSLSLSLFHTAYIHSGCTYDRNLWPVYNKDGQWVCMVSPLRTTFRLPLSVCISAHVENKTLTLNQLVYFVTHTTHTKHLG